jgi:hypothetical protein
VSLTTTISAKVIEDLAESRDGDDETGLCYFYVNESSQKPSNIECIYRCLIAQLAAQKSSLPSFIKDVYKRRGRGGYSGRRSSPFSWDVTFQRMVSEFETVSVVVDALDECEESFGLHDLLNTIAKMLAQSNSKVRVFASSRDLERIHSSFKELKATCIAVDGEELHLDLQIALKHQLYSHNKFARWQVSLKKNIETTLLAQAHGS